MRSRESVVSAPPRRRFVALLIVASCAVIAVMAFALRFALRASTREVVTEATSPPEPAEPETTPLQVPPTVDAPRAESAPLAPSATPDASRVAMAAPPAVLGSASDANAPWTDAQRESIRGAIEGAQALRARMDELETRFRDAGVASEAARGMVIGILAEERTRRRVELEANDDSWLPRVSEYETARRAVERDQNLDPAARHAAIESLRSQAFPGDDGRRIEAWEQLDAVWAERNPSP